MTLRPAFLLLAALTVGACASTPDSQAQELAGCWYFERSDVARALNLPWGVRLTGDTLEAWPIARQLEGVRHAATLTPEGDRDHPFGYWRRAAPDSVEIGYPGGGGLVLQLHQVEEQRMRGTAIPAGDVMVPGRPEPEPQAPVVLFLAQCPEL